MSPTATAIQPDIRTFHSHGVAELRAVILQDEKRVDVHIVDLDAVLRKAKEQNHPVADVILGLVDLFELTEKHPDAHKLEITVEDLDGTGKAAEVKAAAQVKPAPQQAAGGPSIVPGDPIADRDRR